MLPWYVARAREAEIRREAERAQRQGSFVAHRNPKDARRL